MRRLFRWLLWRLLALLTLLGSASWFGGWNPKIPVEDATSADWNHDTFWHHPWGASGVHRGIDIFAESGTPVIAPLFGRVTATGRNRLGGNFVQMIDSRLRYHYFSHLQSVDADKGEFVFPGEKIGTVGNTGNARNRPAHVHYEVRTIIPYLWRLDPFAPQGWRKIYYLNPHELLLK